MSGKVNQFGTFALQRIYLFLNLRSNYNTCAN